MKASKFILLAISLQLVTSLAFASEKDKELIASLRATLDNMGNKSEYGKQAEALIKQVQKLEEEQKEIVKGLEPHQKKLKELEEKKAKRQAIYSSLRESDYSKDDVRKFCESNGCDSKELEGLIDAQIKACSSSKNRGLLNSKDCRQAHKALSKGFDGLESKELGVIEKDISEVNKVIGDVKADIDGYKKEIWALTDKRLDFQKKLANSPEEKKFSAIMDEIVGKADELVIDEKLLLLDAKTLKNDLGIEAHNAQKVISDIAKRYEEKLDESALGSYIHNEIGQALNSSTGCDAVKVCMEGHSPSAAQHNELSRDSKDVIKKLEMKKIPTPKMQVIEQ